MGLKQFLRNERTCNAMHLSREDLVRRKLFESSDECHLSASVISRAILLTMSRRPEIFSIIDASAKASDGHFRVIDVSRD